MHRSIGGKSQVQTRPLELQNPLKHEIFVAFSSDVSAKKVSVPNIGFTCPQKTPLSIEILLPKYVRNVGIMDSRAKKEPLASSTIPVFSILRVTSTNLKIMR